MFWSISLLILLIAGLLTMGPLLGKGAKWRLATLSGILLLPVAGYWLYQGVGTPQALDPAMVRAPEHSEAGMARAHAGTADMATLTERLRKRLEENPNDIEGWVLLGRSYKNLQKFPLAIEALEKADSLSPGMPLVQVELVEARLFASGDPKFTAEMVSTLETAVAAEPSLQKGLWLLGIATAQAGDDAGALKWWEQLRAQLEPGSSIEKSLTEQIAQVRTRLGQAPEPEPASTPASPPTSPPASSPATPGTEIRVELSDAAGKSWPQIPAGTDHQFAKIACRSRRRFMQVDLPGMDQAT